MIVIVRARTSTGIKLFQVEAPTPQDACPIVNALGHDAISAWNKDVTETVAPRSLKKVLAGDYTIV